LISKGADISPFSNIPFPNKDHIDYECKRVLQVFKEIYYKLAFVKPSKRVEIIKKMTERAVNLCLYEIEKYRKLNRHFKVKKNVILKTEKSEENGKKNEVESEEEEDSDNDDERVDNDLRLTLKNAKFGGKKTVRIDHQELLLEDLKKYL